MATMKGGVARDTQNVRLWLVVKTFETIYIIVFTEYLAKAFQKQYTIAAPNQVVCKKRLIMSDRIDARYK